MRSVYAKRAILTLVIAILVVEGYFVYRWYDRYYVDPAASSDASFSASNPVTSESGVRTSPATIPEATVKELKSQADFVHRATPENIVDNSTYVDSPLANDNPNAILLVDRSGESGAKVDNAHPIGVWYDASRGGRWAIFNQDLAPMREDAIFDVIVSEEPGGSAFVHRATSENTVENRTYVDHPLANESPDAVLSITPNWNPGGGAGTYNDHPIDVRYDADEEQWMILNQDLAPVPEGAAFNVGVSGEGPPTN